MAVEIHIKLDLNEFSRSLLENSKEILKVKNEQSEKWLKSAKLRKFPVEGSQRALWSFTLKTKIFPK